MTCKTVLIKDENHPDGKYLINEEDFDENKHSLYEDKAPTKKELLIAEAQELEIELEGNETIAVLEELIEVSKEPI